MSSGYIPGDFWRLCDVCGFKVRSSQTYKRWDNQMVCRADFEERHPQDFVRGRKDHQNVPDPRPESVDRFLGPLSTVTTAASITGATSLTVDLTTRFESGDDIGVTLANSEVARMVIDMVPTSTSLTLTTPLPGAVASGALIVNYDAVAEPDIG